MDAKSIGNTGEDVAAKYLESKGFSIRMRNWRSKIGEIDILATKGGVLHVVEVKSAEISNVSHETAGIAPEGHVDARKIHKLTCLAELYCIASKWDGEVQVDAVAVRLNRDSRRAQCKYYPNII